MAQEHPGFGDTPLPEWVEGFYPERLRTLTLITPVGLSVPGHPPADLFRMPPEEIGQMLYNGKAAYYLQFLPDGHDVDAVVRG